MREDVLEGAWNTPGVAGPVDNWVALCRALVHKAVDRQQPVRGCCWEVIRVRLAKSGDNARGGRTDDISAAKDPSQDTIRGGLLSL